MLSSKQEVPSPSLPLVSGTGLLVGMRAGPACWAPRWHLSGTYRRTRSLRKQLFISTHMWKCTRTGAHRRTPHLPEVAPGASKGSAK